MILIFIIRLPVVLRYSDDSWPAAAGPRQSQWNTGRKPEVYWKTAPVMARIRFPAVLVGEVPI